MRILVCLVMLLSISANAQDQYVSTLDSEFDKLADHLNANERENWEERRREAYNEVTKKIEEMVAVDEILKSEPNYEEIMRVQAFTFFKEVNYVKLESKTNLLEELGKYLFNNALDSDVLPLTRAIEKELVQLQNAQGALQLQSQLVSYFEIQRQVEALQNNLPIKAKYDYRPQNNAWDSDPDLIKTFVVHDWDIAINELGACKLNCVSAYHYPSNGDKQYEPKRTRSLRS